MPPTSTPSTDSAARSPGIRRVGQIAIVAHDVKRATEFYRDTLGLRLLFEAPPGLAFFDCGGVRLMVSAPEGPDSAGSSIVYYDVPDVHGAYDTLRAQGVKFVDEPHVVAQLGPIDLWMVFLRDSEGNLLGLMNERPRAT